MGQAEAGLAGHGQLSAMPGLEMDALHDIEFSNKLKLLAEARHAPNGTAADLNQYAKQLGLEHILH